MLRVTSGHDVERTSLLPRKINDHELKAAIGPLKLFSKPPFSRRDGWEQAITSSLGTTNNTETDGPRGSLELYRLFLDYTI